MRKEMYRMDRAQAIALLERAEVVRLATTTPDGQPVLRTVHGVVVDDAIAFHGAPAGEKAETVGREAVMGAEEIVASIPSYFVDPERACPATTYFRSVQVHGRLEAVEEPAAKARVLAALMARFQAEGGHVPIDCDHPLYRAAVRGILIMRVSLARLDGKAKLGQNRQPAELERVLAALWARGQPGDPRAIELVRAANPATPVPAFLRGPAGTTLSCALGQDALEDALELVADEYWNEGVPRSAVAASHLLAAAWVGARDPSGRLCGTARATSDGKRAWIYDVAVAPAWRRRGIGRSVVALLLDHPALRGVHQTRLRTRDAQLVYAGLGFVDERSCPLPFTFTEMVRAGAPPAGRT
jgi:nitroimidazol reductase NimA-like FMN-containing flavoprotein (pyridoxamine 5'-phosphate oxidase superfamily)/ribosomal protein S18 acetylase RimI-like enzyme